MTLLTNVTDDSRIIKTDPIPRLKSNTDPLTNHNGEEDSVMAQRIV